LVGFGCWFVGWLVASETRIHRTVYTEIQADMHRQNRNNTQTENTSVCVTQNKIIYRRYNIQVYASHRIEIMGRKKIQVYVTQNEIIHTYKDSHSCLVGWSRPHRIRSDAGACVGQHHPTGSPRTRIASTNQSIKIKPINRSTNQINE
jgi:hypothetical protein